ncbi:inactive pancreatic lipase-related protein 1-like [Protopterus annectens]|uniref:inactive pancreatic lipase-related protein 1-like n=1 Tax=Protopterus annectens TaxID=7888 RepID=UPI001CFAC9DB|nr:inactive pancreatic lipase-related protein 1-like [Protopterus annectens]
MLGAWVAALFLICTVYGGQVCYDRLGCFPDEPPWSGTIERPITKLPWSPDKINTRFYLFTPQNPSSYQEVSAVNPSTISTSNYRASRKTRFVIHGFIDKGDENWLADICKKMLEIEDVNCFCVDWKSGSRCPYTQASNNIRVVGAEVAYFIDVLQSNFGQNLSNVHVIGHSLGAHAAGEAGKRKPGLARVTGLDPAEPYFQGTPIEVRLDPTDANFVDAIHTDAAPMIPYLGFGMSQAVGHIDFYANGGYQMPGCDRNAISQIVDIDGIWEGTRDFVACNHLRSYKFYSDSITNPGGFVSYPSSSYDAFESGTGFPCSSSCPKMGHFADSYKVPSGTVNTKFHLNTADARPFARWRFKATVYIVGDRETPGFINVAFYGTNGNSRQYRIVKTSLRPGKSYANFADIELDLGEVTRVKFLWNNDIVNPLFPRLGAEKIVVQRGSDGKM